MQGEASAASADCQLPDAKQAQGACSDMGSDYYAVPAELLDRRSLGAASVPGVVLWPQGQHITVGTTQGGLASLQQYTLLAEVAKLPRYADHVHTSWTGAPILGSMSMWLQPQWPAFATSHGLTNPYTTSHSDLYHSSVHLPLGDQTLESALALSPGNMLQRGRAHMLTASCDLDPEDCCSAAAADLMYSGRTDFSEHLQWLDSAAIAAAEALSAAPSQALTESGQAVQWQQALTESAQAMQWEQALTDSGQATDREPTLAGLHGGVAEDTPQENTPEPGMLHQGMFDRGHLNKDEEWRKYGKGFNFARGSFGEVWRAEKTCTGAELLSAPCYHESCVH